MVQSPRDDEPDGMAASPSSQRPRKPLRIQTNLLAKSERRLLNWICSRLPNRVTPDLLTALSLAGSIVTFCGYVCAREQPGALFVANLGLFLYWFGDSLDGSLARHRCIERPRYGYFLDHSVDALCNLFVMGGLGMSGYVNMDVALLALIAYFMLGMHVFLSAYVTNEFRLSFLVVGPTELRLALVILNTMMFATGPQPLGPGMPALSWYDLPIGFAAVVLLALFVSATLRVAGRLRIEAAHDLSLREERVTREERRSH